MSVLRRPAPPHHHRSHPGSMLKSTSDCASTSAIDHMSPQSTSVSSTVYVDPGAGNAMGLEEEDELMPVDVMNGISTTDDASDLQVTPLIVGDDQMNGSGYQHQNMVTTMSSQDNLVTMVYNVDAGNFTDEDGVNSNNNTSFNDCSGELSICICVLCQAGVDETSLEHHIAEHLGYFPYRCCYCAFRSNTENELKAHASVTGHALSSTNGDLRYQSSAVLERLIELVVAVCQKVSGGCNGPVHDHEAEMAVAKLLGDAVACVTAIPVTNPSAVAVDEHTWMKSISESLSISAVNDENSAEAKPAVEFLLEGQVDDDDGTSPPEQPDTTTPQFEYDDYTTAGSSTGQYLASHSNANNSYHDSSLYIEDYKEESPDSSSNAIEQAQTYYSSNGVAHQQPARPIISRSRVNNSALVAALKRAGIGRKSRGRPYSFPVKPFNPHGGNTMNRQQREPSNTAADRTVAPPPNISMPEQPVLNSYDGVADDVKRNVQATLQRIMAECKAARENGALADMERASPTTTGELLDEDEERAAAAASGSPAQQEQQNWAINRLSMRDGPPSPSSSIASSQNNGGVSYYQSNGGYASANNGRRKSTPRRYHVVQEAVMARRAEKLAASHEEIEDEELRELKAQAGFSDGNLGPDFPNMSLLIENRQVFYDCTLCPYKSRIKSDAREHCYTHTGERPFACEHCGQAFNRRSTLFNHKRTHSEARPFKCPMCSMGFRWKNSMKYHLKSHMSEKAAYATAKRQAAYTASLAKMKADELNECSPTMVTVDTSFHTSPVVTAPQQQRTTNVVIRQQSSLMADESLSPSSGEDTDPDYGAMSNRRRAGAPGRIALRSSSRRK